MCRRVMSGSYVKYLSGDFGTFVINLQWYVKPSLNKRAHELYNILRSYALKLKVSLYKR